MATNYTQWANNINSGQYDYGNVQRNLWRLEDADYQAVWSRLTSESRWRITESGGQSAPGSLGRNVTDPRHAPASSSSQSATRGNPSFWQSQLSAAPVRPLVSSDLSKTDMDNALNSFNGQFEGVQGDERFQEKKDAAIGVIDEARHSLREHGNSQRSYHMFRTGDQIQALAILSRNNLGEVAIDYLISHPSVRNVAPAVCRNIMNRYEPSSIRLDARPGTVAIYKNLGFTPGHLGNMPPAIAAQWDAYFTNMTAGRTRNFSYEEANYFRSYRSMTLIPALSPAWSQSNAAGWQFNGNAEIGLRQITQVQSMPSSSSLPAQQQVPPNGRLGCSTGRLAPSGGRKGDARYEAVMRNTTCLSDEAASERLARYSHP